MNHATRLAVAVVVLALLAVPVAAEEPTSDATLVFDLAAETGVHEHTARMLWNLKTDNYTRDDGEGWNSLYLEQPQDTSGRVVVDVEAATITGDIIERWSCQGDCAASDGSPSWTTNRDTGLTATIVDGRLEPDGDGWSITGSVTISYDTTVTADENPSDCGGTVCYVCADRVCEVGGTENAVAPLEGFVADRTLSLAFADRMEADVYTMDLSHLRRTEFFMSRFSITLDGAILPPPGQVSEETTASTTSTTAAEVPSDALDSDVDSGAPAEQSEADSPESSDAAQSGSDALPVAGESSNEGGGDSATGWALTIFVLFILLGLGVWVFHSLKAMLDRKAIDGDRARSPRPPPPPPNPAEKSYTVGGTTQTYVTTIEEVQPPPPPPPAPTFTVVGTEDYKYKWVEAKETDSTRVHLLAHGAEVRVLERKGDLAKVQEGSHKPVWINRNDLRMIPPPPAD